jgi:hypothetical protein
MLLEEIKNIRSARRDLRNFGLSVGIVLLLIGVVLWYYERGAYPYFLIIGLVLVLLGLALPSFLKPLQKAWMALAVTLGFFMTRLILSLLFFLVFTPISLIGRLGGFKFLDIKTNEKNSSYWLYREVEDYKKEDSEKQF